MDSLMGMKWLPASQRTWRACHDLVWKTTFLWVITGWLVGVDVKWTVLKIQSSYWLVDRQSPNWILIPTRLVSIWTPLRIFNQPWFVIYYILQWHPVAILWLFHQIRKKWVATSFFSSSTWWFNMSNATATPNPTGRNPTPAVEWSHTACLL